MWMEDSEKKTESVNVTQLLARRVKKKEKKKYLGLIRMKKRRVERR